MKKLYRFLNKLAIWKFSLIEWLGILFIISIFTIQSCHPVQANTNPTDYHNHELSEQISQEWRKQAQAQWREEESQWQRNPTADELIYLRKHTALLQEQANGKSEVSVPLH